MQQKSQPSPNPFSHEIRQKLGRPVHNSACTGADIIVDREYTAGVFYFYSRSGCNLSSSGGLWT